MLLMSCPQRKNTASSNMYCFGGWSSEAVDEAIEVIAMLLLLLLRASLRQPRRSFETFSDGRWSIANTSMLSSRQSAASAPLGRTLVIAGGSSGSPARLAGSRLRAGPCSGTRFLRSVERLDPPSQQ